MDDVIEVLSNVIGDALDPGDGLVPTTSLARAVVAAFEVIPRTEIIVVTRDYAIAREYIEREAPYGFVETIHKQHLYAVLDDAFRQGYLVIEVPSLAVVPRPPHIQGYDFEVRYRLTAQARRVGSKG